MMIIPHFAVFEGIDGSGTTTQLERLKARNGYSEVIHTTFEPTTGPVGKLIREALKSGDLLPETLAHLFAADRYEHLHRPGGVLERCAQGSVVVSDRYIPSSLVYQGLECGPELPRKLNAAFPLPEVLIFFDIDPAVAEKRLKARKGLDIYEHLDFQIRVQAAYKALLPEYEAAGTRVALIDAAAPADEVEQMVWRELSNMPILKV
jgi:dTMP kinase